MTLEAKGLTVVLNGRKALSAVSLGLRRGEVLGIVGANGAGKTTLLRAMAQLVPLASGRVALDGQDIAPGRDTARKIGYVEQNPASHWDMAVDRLVALGRLPHHAPDPARVDMALGEMELDGLRGRPVNTLSGGERMRVFIARALAGKPEFLLADEPVAGLDPAHQLRMMALFRQRAQEGLGILLSIHDLSLASRFCDRVLLMRSGCAVACDVPLQALTERLISETLAVEPLVSSHEGERFILPWREINN